MEFEEYQLTDENILEKISFVFTMKGFKGLYFKLKEPLPDSYGIGFNCFQFAFDSDNGIYIEDGSMRFNDFMGNDISDSGADTIKFIRDYIEEHRNELNLRW